jgi:hypothetical protein
MPETELFGTGKISELIEYLKLKYGVDNIWQLDQKVKLDLSHRQFNHKLGS